MKRKLGLILAILMMVLLVGTVLASAVPACPPHSPASFERQNAYMHLVTCRNCAVKYSEPHTFISGKCIYCGQPQ